MKKQKVYWDTIREDMPILGCIKKASLSELKVLQYILSYYLELRRDDK